MSNMPQDTASEIVFETRQFRRSVDDLTRFCASPTYGSDPRAASLFGDSGCGKSTVMRAIERIHPPTMLDGRTIRPLITVEIPSKPSIHAFYAALMNVLGGPILPRESNGEIRNRVLHFVKALGVRILVLDEFQHLNQKVGTDTRGVCDTIKSLMNAGRIGMIFVGTPDAETVIQTDTQILTRRAVRIRLRPFCDTQNPDFQGLNGRPALEEEFQQFQSVLHEFAVRFGCYDTTYLVDDLVAKRVLEFTGGVYRVIRHFVEAAAKDALVRNEHGIDEQAIREALRLQAAGPNPRAFAPPAKKRWRKKPRQMSAIERKRRSANGEFTSQANKTSENSPQPKRANDRGEI